MLGANDGIVSTAALVMGVAASGAGPDAVLLSGLAGAVAGAMSMAAGEYVSVQSQADAEAADLAMEAHELETQAPHELRELATIYQKRGLTPELAQRVAEQLMAEDALGAHARDELGITDHGRARPVQAALASAAAFTVGSALPVAASLLSPAAHLQAVILAVTLVSLSATGALAAYTGGASPPRGALRLVLWGSLAMLATHLVGSLFGTA